MTLPINSVTPAAGGADADHAWATAVEQSLIQLEGISVINPTTIAYDSRGRIISLVVDGATHNITYTGGLPTTIGAETLAWSKGNLQST